MQNPTISNSGFVAGTLVHTDKGLVPIQHLQVGDLVLSKDSNNLNSEAILKPIRNIIQNDEQGIWQLHFFQIKNIVDNEFKIFHEFVYLTSIYPILVTNFREVGHAGKWVKVNDLFPHGSSLASVSYFKETYIAGVKPVFELSKNIGFCYLQDELFDEDTYVQFTDKNFKTIGVNYTSYKSNSSYLGSFEDKNTSLLQSLLDENISKFKKHNRFVFNLEISENHNYFVGNLGILVGDITIFPNQ